MFKKLLFCLLLLNQLYISLCQFPSFEQYCLDFNKVYSEPEKSERKKIYEENLIEMQQIHEYQTGVNFYTDHRDEELPRGLQQGQEQMSQVSQSPSLVSAYVGAPTSFDWRDYNGVTSIKNQAKCGSCWAFASAAIAESHLVINKGYQPTIDLSEQYLLRCTKDSSCGGGYLNYAVSTGRSLPTEQQYPYKPAQYDLLICYASTIQVAYSYNSFYNLTDSQIITLLQDSPVAITVASSGWQPYSGGVFSCKEGVKIDHAVVIVGYTDTYWIVKNQWGKNWGIEGYIYINRDRQANKNCLIGRSVYQLKQSMNSYMFYLAIFMILVAFN